MAAERIFSDPPAGDRIRRALEAWLTSSRGRKVLLEVREEIERETRRRGV